MTDKLIIIVYKGHHCKLKGHIVDNPDSAVIYANEDEVAPWLAVGVERIMRCAFCDGIANLTFEPIRVRHKGENHTIDQFFYWCEKCKEEFETEECMNESLKQLQ